MAGVSWRVSGVFLRVLMTRSQSNLSNLHNHIRGDFSPKVIYFGSFSMDVVICKCVLRFPNAQLETNKSCIPNICFLENFCKQSSSRNEKFQLRKNVSIGGCYKLPNGSQPMYRQNQIEILLNKTVESQIITGFFCFLSSLRKQYFFLNTSSILHNFKLSQNRNVIFLCE